MEEKNDYASYVGSLEWHKAVAESSKLLFGDEGESREPLGRYPILQEMEEDFRRAGMLATEDDDRIYVLVHNETEEFKARLYTMLNKAGMTLDKARDILRGK